MADFARLLADAQLSNDGSGNEADEGQEKEQKNGRVSFFLDLCDFYMRAFRTSLRI
jgi:hypothetical protein